jgi:hypothetical protein
LYETTVQIFVKNSLSERIKEEDGNNKKNMLSNY